MNSTQTPDTGGIIIGMPPSETKAPQILTIIITLGILSTIAVFLRIYTRIKILKIFDISDGVMVLAQFFVIGLALVLGIAVKYGFGTHTWTHPLDDIIASFKLIYATTFVYLITLNTVKLSILFQIRQIFIGKTIQMLTLIGIIVINLWTVTFSLVAGFLCIPLSGIWDFTIEKTCLNFQAVNYTMAAFNILTDFGILSLPLIFIRTLSLPKRQRIVLVFIFSLGFFTCCISIIRLHTLRINPATLDPSWDEVTLMIWAFIEPAAAVITACLTTLRPLVVKYIPSLFANNADTNYDSNNSQMGKQSQCNSTGRDMFSTRDLEKQNDLKVKETETRS